MKLRCKAAFALGLFLMAGSAAFSQEGQEQDLEPAPKNTVALAIRTDLFVHGMFMNIVDERAVIFGIAPWYDRKLTENLSVGGQLGYVLYDIVTWNMHSFSAGASIRYGYRNILGFSFIEGMLGYANIFLKEVSNEFSELREREAQAHYFRYGGKFGHRFEFGKPGGFMVELAAGFYKGHGGNLNAQAGDDAYRWDSIAQDSVTRLWLIGGIHGHLSFGYVF